MCDNRSCNNIKISIDPTPTNSSRWSSVLPSLGLRGPQSVSVLGYEIEGRRSSHGKDTRKQQRFRLCRVHLKKTLIHSKLENPFITEPRRPTCFFEPLCLRSTLKVSQRASKQDLENFLVLQVPSPVKKGSGRRLHQIQKKDHQWKVR